MAAKAVLLQLLMLHGVRDPVLGGSHNGVTEEGRTRVRPEPGFVEHGAIGLALIDPMGDPLAARFWVWKARAARRKAVTSPVGSNVAVTRSTLVTGASGQAVASVLLVSPSSATPSIRLTRRK